MNSRKMNILLRVLLTKSSAQRSVSKFTTLDDYPLLRINFSKSLQRCCSTHAENTTKELDEFADEFDIESNVYDNIDLEAITDNDPKKIKAFKVLVTKLDIKDRKGFDLPKQISIQKWREILSLPSISQRLSYLKYLAIREGQKEERKSYKLIKRKQYEEFIEEKKKQPKSVLTTSSPMVYGLTNTTMFQRLRDSTIEKFYNYKLLDAYVNGPDIVFDCEYSSFMTRKEINSAAFQIGGAWRMNRGNLNPFNVVYTNLSKDNILYERIKLMYPLLDVDPGYPFIYTSQSFLDLYPKDKLIYLSPHAVETMETYEPDKVYIIGCMVDLAMPEPLSLAKAKKFDIRTMKFPLNKYLNWKSGGKALNMDHCIKIMLDIKNGHDWKSTLVKHIPPRKLEAAQPDKPKKDEDYRLDARTIRRMYLKNKVHELIVDKDYKDPEEFFRKDS